MAKANESGSILSFVVIGIILVALLVGGTYFMRQKATVSAEGATQTPTNSQPEKSDQAASPKEEPVAKTPEPPKAPQSNTRPEATTNTPPATLPQTGPTEALSVIVGAALLTATLTAYVRSRRDYASL